MTSVSAEKKQRILVYGMSDNPGGIETYLLNLVKQSKGKAVAWDFVTDFPEIAYKKELKEYGSRIFYIPAKSKGLVKQWSAFSAILRMHPEYKTVYFNILNAGTAFTMAVPWLYRRKIAVHSHNGSADNTKFHKLCMPFMNFMAQEFAACSHQAGAFMFGKRIMQKKQVIIMPNAIESQRYEYNAQVREKMRKELGVEGKYVLCHIGRIVYQKNPKGVIDILKKCLEEEKNCLLLSVGTGDMEAEVHAYAKEKGVEAQVLFLGVRRDVDQIMQAADCFLLPSIYEGLPIVAVEAQAAGLPCLLSENISRETRIIEELVRFLPIQNPELWKREILKVKNNKRISRCEEIQKAGYDLEHQEKNLEKLLEKLI